MAIGNYDGGIIQVSDGTFTGAAGQMLQGNDIALADAVIALQSDTETITPDENGTISQALANNTLYTVAASPALTYLSISVAAGLKYCGIDFSTGATAPTFAYPAGWTWVGHGCNGGTFVPLASHSYRVGIEAYGESYICNVQIVPEVVA